VCGNQVGFISRKAVNSLRVMLNKARALYLVRVSVTCEIIDRREKGGVGGGKKKHILGNYCWLCSKLIELGDGGSKNCLL